MRPTLRTTFLRFGPVALVAACSLAIASSAPGITLYDGSYATDMLSSTPGGLAPASGVTLAYPSEDIALSWDQVPGAKQYQVQLARQSGPSADCSASTSFQLDNIAVTASTDQNEWVPTLTSEADGQDIWTGTYCWRVRTTGKGYGQWSAGHRFTRTWASSVGGLKFFNDHDGAVPRRASDPDFATGSSITRNAGYLTWSRLPGAASYEVEVSPTRVFSTTSTMVRREGITDNRVTLLHLPDDTYYWRVRGIAPNGTEGGWSTGEHVFTVRWLESAWSADSRVWPADSSVQSEMRVGWTPMPGATYYEVQAGTGAGCFWDPDMTNLVPRAFGHWVNLEAEFDQSQPPNLLSTGDPHPSFCRLTDVRATTINNWATINSLIGSEALANINKNCLPVNSPVQCEPASLPVNHSIDYGSAFHGLNEVVGGRGNWIRSGDGQHSEPYAVYWRVRPVYHVTQDNETGWEISGKGGLKAYGSWTKYNGGGENRHHRFELDPRTAPYTSTGSRCEGIFNPGSSCLVHVGTSMQADEAPGVTVDRSMQFPVLTWRPFADADGYLVEVAKDPLFNNVAMAASIGFGTQQSYALTDSLPDNAEGTGYWWRVTPCFLEPVEQDARCMPVYAAASAGLPVSYGLGGYSDAGVAQTFTKQSGVQVDVVPNFEGATPLLRWTRSDVGATDWSGWSRGLEGAQHYEVQLARNPFFTKDARTLKTSIPRMVPYTDGDEEGATKALPDGLWYYRVRGVDRKDIKGAWSTVGSFNKRVEAPRPIGANGASGPGVVVAWAPVEGAGTYQVEWTTDSGFETKPLSGSTLQTSFRIPDTALGRHYWRVRAVVNGIEGSWSGEVRYVDIVPPTTIRYGLNRERTLAGDKVQITGELKVAGSNVNGQRIRLQRKQGGCDNANGRYVDSSTGVTGDRADDGHVNIPARVLQNTCFRMAWTGGPKTRYSAPIAVKVVPNMRVFTNRKLVRRGVPYCTSIRSNVAIRGRARVQYMVGKTWRTSRTTMLRGTKSARLCASITKAGRYKTRVIFDNMKHQQGWKQYDDVARGTGIVRVNDVWRIVRSR